MGSMTNGAEHANGAVSAALDITVLGLNSGTSMVYTLCLALPLLLKVELTIRRMELTVPCVIFTRRPLNLPWNLSSLNMERFL